MTDSPIDETPPPQIWGPGYSWSSGYRADGQNLDATPDTEMPEWRAWAVDGGPTSWPEASGGVEIDRSAVRDVARALLSDLDTYTAQRVFPVGEHGYRLHTENDPIIYESPPNFNKFHPAVDMVNVSIDELPSGTLSQFQDFIQLSVGQFYMSYSSYIARLAQSIEEYDLAEEASALGDLEQNGI
ncbi:hypothetical protein [Streptosporangium sp. KLBMP 9127]|nr:hypothetical protein [Streptosporangium sp. KLBMP 9127]